MFKAHWISRFPTSRFSFAVLALLALIAAQPSQGSDWPQWRGPMRDGISTEKGLTSSLSSNGPPVVWMMRGVGKGYSSVSVAKGQIFTMGDGKERSYVHALSEKDGKVQWSAPLGATGGNYEGTRCTPTVDGDLVFALGQHGDLICVEAKSGTEMWRKSMEKNFGGKMMSGWGYSESPLVDGAQVVVTPGGSEGTVVALDRKTGAVVWRSKDWTDRAAYSSVIVAEIGGVRQYIQISDAHVAGIAAKDGAVLWKAKRKGSTAVIPTPIYKDNHVLVSSGYGVGCNLFKITAGSAGFDADEVYANKDLVNHHGGMVLVGDHVYAHSDSKGWVCMEFMTGKLAWSNPGVGKGALVCADGKLFTRKEDKQGTVAMVMASPDGYKEHGRFAQAERSTKNSWAHPVIANGRLYLRDQDALLCYDVTGK